MRCVVIESPYSGNVEKNEDYARQCVRDSLQRGESPLASHLLYTQAGILDDTNPAERAQGISAGHAWIQFADALAVYLDRGLSEGMKLGIAAAVQEKIPVEYRYLFERTHEEVAAANVGAAAVSKDDLREFGVDNRRKSPRSA